MLPKTSRLLKKEVDEVLERGKITHSSLFSLRHMETEDQAEPKISAVAPKKVARTAVKRNSVRRKIYSSAKPLLSGVNPRVSMIIFAKEGALKSDSLTLQKSLRDLFVKAGIMR